MSSFGERSADDRPDLADAARLARKLVHRAVRTARTEDQPLRRVLLDHLGPDAATLPSVTDTAPLYEQVNLQVGAGCVAGGQPGREHEVIGITGVPQMRFNDVTIGDLIQAAPGSMYGSAGVGRAGGHEPALRAGRADPAVREQRHLPRPRWCRTGSRSCSSPSGLGMRHTESEPPGHRHQPATGPAAVLREIRTLAHERSVFRGQVISFGPDMLGPGDRQHAADLS